MIRHVTAVVAAIVAAFGIALADESRADDPAVEARARALDRQLRCVVCQSQSIDESDAPLAADMRRAVRERLAAGDSDEQALDFLVARYGDYVLLKPRAKGAGLVLWLFPVFAAAAAGAGAFVYVRGRRHSPPPPLTEEEERTIAAAAGRKGP